MEMRLRVLDFGVDKYGLNAYIFDSTNDSTTNYDKVLFSRDEETAPTRSASSRKGEWADVKVKIVGGALGRADRRHAGQGRGADARPVAVRLFHTSVSRAIATWPTWPGEPGFTGDFAEYLAQTFPTSTAADFAILEAGVVSEETYVQQGLYWETGHQPMLEYVIKTYKPDLLLAGYADDRRVPAPVPRPGLEEAAERRARTRPTTTSRSTACPTAASPQREAFIRDAPTRGRRRR